LKRNRVREIFAGSRLGLADALRSQNYAIATDIELDPNKKSFLDGTTTQRIRRCTLALRIRKASIESAVCAAIAFFLPVVAVRAECFGYYCSGVIQAMTVTDGAVHIMLVGGTTGLTNCTPYSQSYFTLLKSNINYESYYATLLAAYMAKESVTLRPVDSSPNCTVAYMGVP
jgi:hypothetical protein